MVLTYGAEFSPAPGDKQMFPRISTSQKKNKTYKYLVMSESIRNNGRSTTRNIANLGNIERFTGQDSEHLIDGLIKIFNLDKYVLGDDVEIIESLEHGGIIFWRKFWQELGLSKILRRQLNARKQMVTIAIERYVEMIVVNRSGLLCQERRLGLMGDVEKENQTVVFRQRIRRVPLILVRMRNPSERSMRRIIASIRETLSRCCYPCRSRGQRFVRSPPPSPRSPPLGYV